jgi:hypothetical protein
MSYTETPCNMLRKSTKGDALRDRNRPEESDARRISTLQADRKQELHPVNRCQHTATGNAAGQITN